MILTDNVYLNPEDLYNIKESIYNEIDIKCKDFCSQDIGYIIQFNGIKNIKGNHINRCGNKILFLVDYEVDTFKPEIGDVLNVDIIHIFEEGIILSYINKVRILVPKQHLIDVGYYFEDGTYNGWQMGDNIDIVVDKIRYEKSRFDCIADLKL
jgi:DNA-directed RNA polymerase subunit E'/Rpb7